MSQIELFTIDPPNTYVVGKLKKKTLQNVPHETYFSSAVHKKSKKKNPSIYVDLMKD